VYSDGHIKEGRELEAQENALELAYAKIEDTIKMNL